MSADNVEHMQAVISAAAGAGAAGVLAFRERHGLTQKALADLIGYRRLQVWKWENGAAPVPVAVAALLSLLDHAARARDSQPARNEHVLG